MPVFALYNFNDTTTVVDDAPVNGLQNGLYLNGAAASGGDLVLDGINDFAKIYPSSEFQMDRGTLEINFTPTDTGMTGPQTVLSRDSVGENQGSYRVEVYPDGSVQITHETEGGATSYSTGPGFYAPGDTINLSYSWDQGGAGGQLVIENQTTGNDYTADVPPELTMDMADQSQPWIVGAGQANSDPDVLNNIGDNFTGTVEFFSLSDTVDNLQDPDANPDVAETDEDTAVIIDPLANDTDPNGDTLSILGVPTATHGTVSVNADGTITYTPDANYNGPDTITYTVTDPAGNTATSTVAVTVNPVNDAPEANPDTSTTAINTPVTLAVVGNDSDVDGDTLSILGTPTSAQGTVVVNADGSLTFTPNTGFTGTATVDYTVTDPEGLTDTTTWTITVGDGGARDGIVSGTTGGDLIDFAYVDPTDGDRVDANDALIPGDALNDDRIEAGEGNDTVIAGLGDDTVNAGTGDDSVNGNDGNDQLNGEDGDDSIYGDAGDDTVDAGTGDDEVVGGLGNDQIDGGAGNDNLQGNEGDDLITGGDGNDTLLGGDGNDTLTSGQDGSPDRGFPGLYPVDATPDDDRDSLVGGAGDDLIRSGDDADTLEGGAGNDRLEAGFDDDTVDGGAGNDTVIAGEGNDTVGGGDNDDLMFGGDGPGGTDPTEIPDATDPDPDNNRDSLSGGAGNDTIYGQDDDDTITGGSGNDLIFGGIDEDLIDGGSGDDDLRGGEGADTITGGDGNDTVFGQQDNDLIDTSGGDEPLPDAGYPGLYPSDTDPENDRDSVSGGLGDDTITTGDDADTITGDDGNDVIDAGVDDDLVDGGRGNDTILGSEGDDTIDGGNGDDLIYGGLAGIVDVVELPDAVDLRPDNNRDSIIGGDGNDTIYGRDDDDTIDGGAGNDLIDGGIDEDSILGGTGNDTVLGSQGADTAAGGDDRDVFLIGTQEQGIGDSIDGNEGGDDVDTLDLRGAGPLSVVYDPTNPENGTITFRDADGNPTGTLDFINIENVIPCFTPGTLIATPKGEMPVESLRPGDKVVTRDNGIQEIRWVGEKPLTGQDLRLNSHLQPVFIKRGALGNGLPEQDMMVSPNHRLLVANDRTQLYFDEHEVLVAAKHLVGTKGVHAVEAIGVTYIHFMFDRHEVVLSNGAWTESFQPGDYTLKGMGNAQRSEIYELFPELKTREGLDDYQAARRTLKKHEARLLVK
jgi:Ca2+-binding RTX toxin-like protein